MEDKWVVAVAKLNKLTQEGDLTWKPSEAKDSLEGQLRAPLATMVGVGPEPAKGIDVPAHSILSAYEASYKRKRLAIFERKYSNALAIGGWSFKVSLGFLDDADQLIFTAPEVSGLVDLLISVKHQQAGVEDFLAELLEGD